MEPTPQPLRYLVYTNVYKIAEQYKRTYVSGHGYEAKFEDKSLGWFLYLEGSHEAIHMGGERPPFAAGDRVKITFEKVQA